ncbi:unnamed protein product, partial [Prorocentrum cordatum]
MCAAPKTPKISEHLNISPDVLAEALCIQALQKKLSLNSAKLSGRLGTSPALLATGASRPHPGAPDRPEARPREHTCDPGRRGLRHGRRRRRGRP